jgi:hypothetical protein
MQLFLKNESSNAKRWLRGHLPAGAWASLKGMVGKKG